MAIVTSMWLKGAKKRLGGTVIYQAMGQTRQRELASEVSNPRTESQMGQRVKWANLVNLYRANRSWMKYAFETKKSNQSEYNKFMSLNVSESRIYLTKQIANAGGCVVDAYIVTQGSLPSIEFVPTSNGYWRSNIEVTGIVSLDNITVKAFSDVVVALNPGIRYGDQLSFIRMTQMTNASTGVPYVVVREFEVIIDTNNLQPLENYLPLDYFYTWGGDEKYLAIGSAYGRSGGFVMILSRTISGKTYVSSQRVIPVHMESYIQAFSSSGALQAAIDSYGVSEDAFLSSTYASQDNQAATMLAMLYVTFGDTGGNMVAGSRFVLDTVEAGDHFNFVFNDNELPSPTLVKLITNQGTIVLETPTAQGNTVRGLVPAQTLTMTNLVIFSASATLDSQEYTISFAVLNEDTIEGLE